MTLYTEMNTFEGVKPTLDTPSVGEYMGAVVEETWNSNPAQNAARSYQLAAAMVGGVEIDGSEAGFPSMTYTPARTRRLELEEQARRISESGLEGRITPTPGYTEEALDIVMRRKHEELAVQEIRGRAPMVYAPLGLAAGLGVSLADPVNVASAFFPAVPEARALALLRGAPGAWGRAGVRAGLGAVEGTVGAALAEPAVYGAKTFEQADYDMLDSVMNIGFGAVFSAALRPAAGAVAERVRARAGLRQPWEIVDATDATEALRHTFSREMQDALAKARPDMEAGQLQEISRAAAAVWDARARTWAYDMGRSPEEYYQRYKPDFRAAAEDGAANPLPGRFAGLPAVEADSGQWFGAGKAINADSSQLRKALQQWAKKEFPERMAVTNAEQGWEVRVTPAGVKSSLHHGYDELLAKSVPFIPRIIESGMYLDSTEKKAGLMSHIFANKIRLDGKDYVVGFVLREDGNGNRFYDHELTEIVNPDWLKPGKQRDAVAELRTNRGDVMNILRDKLGVNDGSGEILFHDQRAPREARAAVRFAAEGDARAVIDFFSAADPTSAPHELYHIFRRELAETAADAVAPARAREQWRQIEEFVGAEPGQAWTRDMEETFALAGERFLLEGRAPTPALAGVFERLRQWFLEIYGNAESSGLPISEEMRRVFGDMLAMPMQDADQAFRYALGDVITHDVSQEFSAPESAPSPAERADAQTLRDLTEQSAMDLQDNLKGVAASEPEAAAAIDAEYAPHFAQADADLARAQVYRTVLEQAALCEARR